MNPRVSLFLLVILVAALYASGCTAMQRQKVYTCPSCKQVVPSTATICPNCGQRLMPAGTAPAAGQPAAGQPAAGTPPKVARGPARTEKTNLPMFKVSALMQLTDSNHWRFTPAVSVEFFKIEQGPDDPIICFDAGIADQAIFFGAGARGMVKDAPALGGFLFMMFDWRRTIKRTSIGPYKPHFCVGFGVTIGGF